MIVNVKLFAAGKEIAGTDEVSIDVPDNADVATIRLALSGDYPALADLLARSRFAIDQQYVADNFVVIAEQEVAFIPPVSGG